MKTIYAVLLLAIFFLPKADAQHYLTNAGGVTVDEALSIAAKPSGISYITGYYSGNANFGSSNFNTAGLTDGFVSKLDATGSFLWTNSFGGSGIDKGIAIAIDNAENVYVAMAFESVMTIGTNSFTSFGLRDILIAKYSSAGILIWAQQAGGIDNDNITSIAADNAGNVAITGTFTGTSTFGSNILNSTVNPITSNPSADIFIAKLNTSGVFLWSKNGAAVDDDYAADIAFDQSANVYLYAQFSDTITFDVTHYNNINNAVCLVKFDSSGNELWFNKLVGTSTQPTSITIDATNHVIAIGNFTGTLNIFTTPFTTLNATYDNRYYILKFSSSGNLIWQVANSSNGFVNATDVVTSTNSNIYIIGEFRCRMNDFADVYGQGVFNSVGYRDIFAASYNSSGTWQWAQQSGGPKDDAAYSACLNSNNEISFTGSFEEIFNAPLNNSNGVCYTINSATTYCGDSNYNSYCKVSSTNGTVVGNRDVIAARCMDASRQPYDYYIRSGSICMRDELGICINEIISGLNCIDTFMVCPLSYALLSVTTKYTGVNSPHINYQWSNGSTSASIVSLAGNNTVTVSTEDGCFSHSATIFIGSQPSPLSPLITDSKGININANPTAPVTLCAGDSVILSASNISAGYLFFWTDGSGQITYNDSITVSQNGVFYFTVGTASQCPQVNSILINVVAPLPDDTFKIIVNNDFDQDDTVSSCFNNIHVSLVDSVTGVCYPESVSWWSTPFSSQIIGGFPCFSSATTSFIPDSTGLYTISAISIVQNLCDTDTIGPVSKTVYFIKLTVPDPPILSIAGETELCPSGDTILLTCDTAPNYHWTGPSIITNDTLQSVLVTSPGMYTVTSTVISVDGCQAQGSANIILNYKPNPVIAITPNSGIICPNDSISLVCYTPGTYQWIGPSGSLGVDSFMVYNDQPGDYYCIVTDTTGCVLLSNTVTAYSYSSPSMLVTPSNIVCNGITATLQIIAGDGSALQWQTPLSGNNPIQLVDTAGTYTCAVLSCNITTILSTTITSPTFPNLIGTGGSTTICFGDSVQLNAPSGYSYLWFPTGDTVLSIYAHASGFYYVQMTDSTGCYDFTDSVFVFQVSQPVLPVISANSPVCEGSSINLSTTPVPGLTYNWAGPSGFSSTLLNPVLPNALLADSGLYTLYVLNGACSSDTATVNISVMPQPMATALSNSPLCTSDTLFLSASGNNLVSYQWNGPSGFSSTIQNPVLNNLTTANSGTYSVVGFDGTCYSDTIFINVQILSPPANPAVSANSPVCEGGTLQLTSTSTATDFYWIGPTGFTSTLSNPTISNVQLNQAGVYYLVVANGSCFSDTVAYTVTVNPTPPPPVITGNNSYCENDSISLITSTVAVSYFWIGPAGFSSSQQQVIIYPATVLNSGLYQLAITDGLCLSDTASILITVNPGLPPPALNSVGSLCEGNDLLLSTASSGFTNYFWTGPAGFTSTDQNPVVANITVTNAGNYSLIVSNGCESVPAVINVSINKNPNLTNINSNSPVCEGDELQLTFSATDFDSVYWNFGSTVLSGNPNLIIQNAQLNNSGFYVVNLSNVNCKNSDSLLAEVNGCDVIIPNVFTPNNDGYNDVFGFSNASIANINYKIFDRWGLVVYEGSGNHLSWNGKLKGTGNDVPEGTYYYFFDLTFVDKTQKVVKGYFELLR